MEFRSQDYALPGAHHDALSAYREYIRAILTTHDLSNPEGALAFHPDAPARAREVVESLGVVSHLLLVGIGGSSLGTEAVHEACGTEEQGTLHVIDALSSERILRTVAELKNVPLSDIAVVIISKSGSTTETIANASLLLELLTEQYGESLKERVVIVTDDGSKLEALANAEHYRVVPMPRAIGGRYSVFTTVGLVPLALLGHDIGLFLQGAEMTLQDEMERELPHSFISASMLGSAHERAVTVYDTFLFDTALRGYGLWRRQLLAESLGKSESLDGRTGTFGPLPTVSTVVDLHSVGQLYMGGFRGIHTDFVSLDTYGDSVIPVSFATPLVPHIDGKTTTEVIAAIYQGVTGAYRERLLPFNEYRLKNRSLVELGALMAFSLLETMYAAELLGVDAFNQPNVELYKKKTREALDQ